MEILCTFAPAFKAKFLDKHWKTIENKSKKDLQVSDKDFIFATRKTMEILRLGSWKNKIKNILKKACRIKKKLYFCTRFETQTKSKKRRHVHRHIELTAVSNSDVWNKEKKVRWIARFTDVRNSSNNTGQKFISVRTIYDEEFDPGSGWTLAAGLTHASRGVELAC